MCRIMLAMHSEKYTTNEMKLEFYNVCTIDANAPCRVGIEAHSH